MPLFDRNNPPAEFTGEMIDEINALVERLRAMKTDAIVLAEPATAFRLSNMVRCYVQAHIRRSLVFLEAGVAEIEAGRHLAAELCTRAVYESIASFRDFADTLAPLLEAADFDKIAELVSARSFATRIPSFLKRGADKAVQILDQIDRMKKHFPTFREAYDHLSDIVHPNALGVLVYFAKISEGRVTFPDVSTSSERARTSLAAAGVLMAFFELSLDDIERGLVQLSAKAADRLSDSPDAS
jgi:hypothetical protein